MGVERCPMSPADVVKQVHELAAQGKLEEAIALARREGLARPDDAEIYNALGTIFAKAGDVAGAREAFEIAITRDPSSFKPHANLSAMLRTHGDLEGALVAIKRATELAPEAARFFARRGQIESDLDRESEAAASYSKAHRLEPTPAHRDLLARSLLQGEHVKEALELLEGATPMTRDALVILATAYDAKGATREVDKTLRAIIETKPPAALCRAMLDIARRNALLDLGVALVVAASDAAPDDEDLATEAVLVKALLHQVHGRIEEAFELLDARAQANPSPRVYVLLLSLIASQGLYSHSARVEAAALRQFGDDAAILDAVGAMRLEMHETDGAIEMLERSLKLDPKGQRAQLELANCYFATSELGKSNAHYRQALALGPANLYAHSSALFASLHDENQSPKALYDAHRSWADRFAVASQTLECAPRSLDPERRLRIGYLSSDFRNHACARFTLPILRAHDRSRFDIYCYGHVRSADSGTRAIQALDLTYRELYGTSSRAIAQRIAEDEIDILVELVGHTAGNLLHVLSYRPAPLQGSYLGYPATTGMLDVDFRLTDARADPVGLTESWHTERLFRLERGAWTFEDVSSPPIVERDEGSPIVFSSFNRPAKLSDSVLRAWARILIALPDSLLLLKGRGLQSNLARRRIESVLVEGGVDPARVLMVGWAPTPTTHLATWGDVDIALDSHPYAGTTTTCEALRMGVPVVTLAGDSHVSRVGVSLLETVGLGDLVAKDWDDYVARAVALARDPARRRALRTTMRERMAASALGDGVQFTRTFEAGLRELWRAYVQSARANAPANARLSTVEPRRYVAPSLRDRETFVAIEQGVERDEQAAWMLGHAATGSRGASLEGGDRALAYALKLAARGVQVRLFEPDPERMRRVVASVVGTGIELLAAPLQVGGSIAMLFGAAASTRAIDAHSDALLVADTPEDLWDLARSRLEQGRTLARVIPALDALCVVDDEGLGALSQSVVVLAAETAARLELAGGLVRRTRLSPTRSNTDPLSPRPAFFAHLDAFELDAASSPSVWAFQCAKRVSLPIDERAAWLDEALVLSADLASDPVGAALTRARIAIEAGRRELVAPALLPLLTKEVVTGETPLQLPRGAFLLPHPDADGESPVPTSSWLELRCIEALLLYGVRSSFDRPRADLRLLLRYFNLGGTNAALNRRFGALCSVAMFEMGVAS